MNSIHLLEPWGWFLFACFVCVVSYVLLIKLINLLFTEFWDSVSYRSSWPPTCYVVENDFEFLILLSWPLSVEITHRPAYLVSVMLGIESRALYVLGNHPTHTPNLQTVILCGQEVMIFPFYFASFLRVVPAPSRYSNEVVWLNYLND